MNIPFRQSRLIDKVLSQKELIEKPPVLLDIGASGTIHKKWKSLAKHSICIAFDADSRDFDPSPAIAKSYKMLVMKNALVTEGTSKEVDFHLTQSPYCSSLLKPNANALTRWAFAPLFDVTQTVRLKATNLSSLLQELNLDRIDWFKSDTQGTDLRLFKSVPTDIQSKVMAAEFEPGIMDAYEGEDKLHAVLSFMDSTKSFWLADLAIKGTLRIQYSDFKEIFPSKLIQKVATRAGRISPGWGEMTYLNTFSDPSRFTRRDILLGWVCATLLGQHGFALELTHAGKANFDAPLFDELASHSRSKIKRWLISRGYFSTAMKKSGLLD